MAYTCSSLGASSSQIGSGADAQVPTESLSMNVYSFSSAARIHSEIELIFMECILCFQNVNTISSWAWPLVWRSSDNSHLLLSQSTAGPTPPM